MTQSTTDWLQQSRFTVVQVDSERRRVRVKGHTDACTDFSCGPESVVLAEEGQVGLDALNPGDVVRVEAGPGGAERIIVVRRVWEELTSPEF